MKLLQKTCREAAALLVAREDRTLPWADRLALRLHLLACTACPRFARQMLTLRNSMKQWRNYTESSED
jgi:Putative zinc-finger